MKKLLILAIPAIVVIAVSCDGPDRPTGNDEAAAETEKTEQDSSHTQIRPDTSVTGVSGNTNAVNASGNAGNGSGMGSSSMTDKAQQTTTPK